MHSDWPTYLRSMLALHIACGGVAFVCAPVALATAKGGKTHRRWGKIYFWAMAGVAVTALILSFALPIFFLAMVAVFSFYSAFAGYRILSLKDMYRGARPKAVDWVAAVITILSSFLLLLMGFLKPQLMGVGVIQVAGQLHRGFDGFLGGKSFALVRRGVVGVALADHHRRARDRHLDDLLQKAVFAETETGPDMNRPREESYRGEGYP